LGLKVKRIACGRAFACAHLSNYAVSSNDLLLIVVLLHGHRFVFQLRLQINVSDNPRDKLAFSETKSLIRLENVSLIRD